VSQILNLTLSLSITSWMFGFWPEMTSSLANVNKHSGLLFSTIFLKIIAHFRNQSSYARGFYDVKGTWWATHLKRYKTFAYHL